MSPLVLLDHVHRAARLARATGELVFILAAPGAGWLAVAWLRQRREWAR